MLPKKISLDIFKYVHIDAEGIMHSKHIKIRMLTSVLLACAFFLLFAFYGSKLDLLLIPGFILLLILSYIILTQKLEITIALLFFSLISSEFVIYGSNILSNFLLGAEGNLLLLLLLNLLLVFILEVKLHW